MSLPTSNARLAFSLVELSIVLVILGLLVGGVLSGQALIKASELRKFTSYQTQYATALQSFRDKYFALPADMPNATQFWGRRVVGAGCNGTPTTASTTGTCDGNGDGIIEWDNTGVSEHHRVWEQLSRAGLIEGSYSYDHASPLPEQQTIGVERPKLIRNSSAIIGNVGTGLVLTDIYQRTGTVIKMGGYNSGASQLSSGVVQPDEAYSIDTKVDDGKPGTGSVVAGVEWPRGPCSAQWAGGTMCVDGWYVGTVGSSRQFNLTATGNCARCNLYFWVN